MSLLSGSTLALAWAAPPALACAGSCHDPVPSKAEISLSHQSRLPWQYTVCCALGLQEPEMMVLLQHWGKHLSFPLYSTSTPGKSADCHWRHPPLAPCAGESGSRHWERAWPVELGSRGLEQCLRRAWAVAVALLSLGGVGFPLGRDRVLPRSGIARGVHHRSLRFACGGVTATALLDTEGGDGSPAACSQLCHWFALVTLGKSPCFS